jgi:hypothetical protein
MPLGGPPYLDQPRRPPNAVPARAHSGAMASAPRDQERRLLLWCPEQGGWHTGEWWEGSWRNSLSLIDVLEPVSWTELPPDLA